MYRKNDERMGLLSYIKGRRRGPEAHRLEREAMQDAFLADALDGYDAFDGADAGDRLSQLQQKVLRRTARRSRIPLYSAVAAVLLLALSVSVYLFSRYDLPRESLAVGESPTILMNVNEYSEPAFAPAEENELPEPVAAENGRSHRVAERTARKEPAADSPVSQDADAAEAVADVVDFSGKPESVIADDAPAAADGPEISEQKTLVWEAASRKEMQSRQQLLAKTAAPKTGLPAPAGGYAACYDYIRKNIAVSADTTAHAASRTVVLRFVVDGQGRPGDFSVVESFSPATAQEVIRLLQAGPDWAPSGTVPAFTVTF